MTFCVANKYLGENGLQWKACTDAAFSDGKVRGFIANVKEVNPETRSHHWLVYYNPPVMPRYHLPFTKMC
jgi:hypothetical protein